MNKVMGDDAITTRRIDAEGNFFFSKNYRAFVIDTKKFDAKLPREKGIVSIVRRRFVRIGEKTRLDSVSFQ